MRDVSKTTSPDSIRELISKGVQVTNYVFGKFYKTKCGKKVVYAPLVQNFSGTTYHSQFPTMVFIDEEGILRLEHEIESEWQDEKPKQKIKLYAYLVPMSMPVLCQNYTALVHFTEEHRAFGRRVPSEDKIVEVES